MTEVLTIAEAGRQIAARQLSPVELTQAHLARIRALDPILNAFVLVTEERAVTDARAAESRQMAGALRGPLDGIPIAHKDIYNTAAIRTTAHSSLLETNVPTTCRSRRSPRPAMPPSSVGALAAPACRAPGWAVSHASRLAAATHSSRPSIGIS